MVGHNTVNCVPNRISAQITVISDYYINEIINLGKKCIMYTLTHTNYYWYWLTCSYFK